MIIAIDGPAGSGKSSVCRLLATQLGFAYLDTGAMYRAVAWALHQSDFDFHGTSEPARILLQLPLHFTLENGALVIRYQERPLEDELREPPMSQLASRVSRFQSVRTFLTEWQKRLATQGDVVAEGRDMTTVVFADTPFKIYLTADIATRTRRRLREYEQKKIPMDYATLEDQMKRRDEADEKRALSPLRCAPDAFFLDTSQMTIEQVVERIKMFIDQKNKHK